MKIQGPNKTSGTAATRKTSRPEGVKGGGFDDYIAAGSVHGSQVAVAPQAMTSIDALLAAQSVEDPTEKAARKRMTKRADNVLVELDKLQLAMMSGKVSMDHMIGIADMVASHRERVTDRKLAELLDEIDLRAQVELAKMRKALDKVAE